MRSRRSSLSPPQQPRVPGAVEADGTPRRGPLIPPGCVGARGAQLPGSAGADGEAGPPPPQIPRVCSPRYLLLGQAGVGGAALPVGGDGAHGATGQAPRPAGGSRVRAGGAGGWSRRRRGGRGGAARPGRDGAGARPSGGDGPGRGGMEERGVGGAGGGRWDE